jgi:hypothetical protein
MKRRELKRVVCGTLTRREKRERNKTKECM